MTTPDTSDLVKRLRAWADLIAGCYEVPAAAQPLYEAADALAANAAEIARLKEEIETLKQRGYAKQPVTPKGGA